MTNCFAPLGDTEWPPALEDMRGGFATGLNVYRVMAHNPALLAAWRDFRNHVVLNNRLDPPSLEIVILRTGFRRGSRYEWMQHIVRGRAAGLDDRRIAAATRPPDQAASAEDAMLMRCVDALVDANRLPADLRRELTARFGKEGVLDMIATVGMYSTLAWLLESLGTPIDVDIAVALDRAPLAP
ncbi:hypothetical protein ASE00_08935 [Sphingomonas sp. Root710]|uniref:carboxymuconolactone decarboxylase family protein n=1 Tax=Sphingomonas sp. Root710 TaxID=1736594 RepID=UPI0006FB92E8|nr:carboxymuconolactone decarboxylase family protein [Sphingomonas sp. Root710]KRB82211.1 hypothetical protein ASE00_08935 [Sphingomonas sp. Root710]